MSWGKGHKDGGKGGKLGHSNMAYWGSNEEAKDATRKQRRQEDRATVAEGHLDAAAPDRVEPYRRAEPRGKVNARTGGKHCPICLARLRLISTKSRRMKHCNECQGHLTGKVCQRCGDPWIWENKQGAACERCGALGGKTDLIRSDDAK